jgi:uncharacterized Tic20 family protein
MTNPNDSASDKAVPQPDDSERVSRLSSPLPEPTAVENSDDGDAVVPDYETRYRPAREFAGGNVDDGTHRETAFEPPSGLRGTGTMRDIGEGKRKSRMMPRSYSTARVTDDERLWASVAHASAWITFLGGIFTIGAVVPVSIFIPLLIYFLWRRRSDYVAFHALQAFTLQLIGTVGAAVILAAGGLVWGIGMVIAILALVILVGFILVPLWGLVGLALLVITLVMPLAMVFYGTLAALETYNGRDYHYPFIARWVDRQLAGGFLNAV